MSNDIVATRQRSYDRTLVKYEKLASISEDYTLSAAEEIEFNNLSNTLARKHELLMRALRTTGQLEVRAEEVNEFMKAW